MAFELPPPPYAYDALQPYMSAETLQYHHDKHHKAYVDNLNKLLSGSGLGGKSLEDIIKASYGKNLGVFNNAGQDFNHIHFWPWMKKGGGGKRVPGSVQALIDRDLGGYDKFRNDFIEAGKTQFGSGWAWLTLKGGKLEVTKTPNGENPLVHGGWPLLGVDVGASLLHRLSQRAAEISRGLVRSSDRYRGHVEEIYDLAPKEPAPLTPSPRFRLLRGFARLHPALLCCGDAALDTA